MASGPRYDIDQRPHGERRALLERTPPGSSVLDVGCWSGHGGRFLIEERSAVVDGIEPDAEMAAIAAERYRRVLAEPVETAAPRLVSDGARYDVLLFLDVLEHLVDPQAVLRLARQLLAPGGRALVSLPNVAHWSVRKQLLRGRWEYEDFGLLDRTHLRFFTERTAEALVAAGGWRIAWRSWSFGRPPVVHLPERRLGILRRWPRLFGVQMLFDLRPHSG